LSGLSYNVLSNLVKLHQLLTELPSTTSTQRSSRYRYTTRTHSPPTMKSQSESSFISSIASQMLDNMSEKYPNSTRRALKFASFAGTALSQRYQSTVSEASSLWSQYRCSLFSGKSLDLATPVKSRTQVIIERMAEKYEPRSRLTLGACSSSSPVATQYSPRIQDHPTQTTACTSTESPSATISIQPSIVSTARYTGEILYSRGFACHNSQRDVEYPIGSPSYPEQGHSLIPVLHNGTSPPGSDHSERSSETSSSSRQSSASNRLGNMDVNLNDYPVKDELPFDHEPCLGDSEGASIDAIGDTGSVLNLGGVDMGGGNFSVGDCGIQ